MYINNNNNNNSNNNINLFIGNRRLYNKNSKDQNIQKGNIQYLSSQNKNNLKLKMNMNIINANNQKQKEKIIKSYISKSNQHKSEKDSQNNIISNTVITESDNKNKKSKNNDSTFNSFSNSKKKYNRKQYIESIDNKQIQIYIKNRVHNSNKNIKKQYINSLFPNKNLISKIFTNFHKNLFLKYNSFKFRNQNYPRNMSEGKNHINSPNFPISPSSIAIELNPFRKKYNLNIKIKESNSTKNVTNSNEKVNLKTDQDKCRRNFKELYSLNYNSNTISTTNTDRIKKIYISKKINPKERIKNNYENHIFNNYGTIVTNSQNNNNLNNYNNINYKIKNINNYNFNANYINNINIKNFNVQKFNSTSNIKKPINMNININMSNNSKNKIYLNAGSCRNIIENKIYKKKPLNTEFETSDNSKKKRTYIKSKKMQENYRQNNIVKNNINRNNINTISNNKISSIENNHYFDSLGHISKNQNDQKDDIKNEIILEELNKKKKIILPISEEINNINININGCNVHNGCLTSRTSNKVSKKKYKGIFNTNGQEIKYYNQEFKIKVKDKNNIKKNNNIISRNDNNPIKINKLYDNSNNYNYNYENPRISGFLTYKK